MSFKNTLMEYVTKFKESEWAVIPLAFFPFALILPKPSWAILPTILAFGYAKIRMHVQRHKEKNPIPNEVTDDNDVPQID